MPRTSIAMFKILLLSGNFNMLLRQLVRIYFQGGSEWESKKRDSNLQKVVSLEIETENLELTANEWLWTFDSAFLISRLWYFFLNGGREPHLPCCQTGLDVSMLVVIVVLVSCILGANAVPDFLLTWMCTEVLFKGFSERQTMECNPLYVL